MNKNNQPLWKDLFIFVIPLMLSNILQSVSGTISSIILGRMMGIDALAAVSAFFPVSFFLISFVIGIGNGSSVLIGQAYGARNMEKVHMIMGTTLSATFLLGMALALLGGTCTQELLLAVGTPANIMTDSMLYARIMFFSMPVLFLHAVFTTFLRSTGDSRTPFYFLILSTILGVILTPLLIIGWSFLPPLGVAGAAYATAVATLLTFVILLVYLNMSGHVLRFTRAMVPYLRIDRGILQLILKIGIPSSVQMVFISLSEIAVVALVNSYGSNATAAYGAVNQVVSYVEMPAISLGAAVSVFGAQAVGEGKFDKLQGIMKAGIRLNLGVGGLLVALTYLFGRQILSLFLTDDPTLIVAYRLLVITLWGYLVFGNLTVLSGIMRATGTVFWPTLLTISSIWGVLVPMAYVLSARIGIEGIWAAYPAEFMVSLAIQYVYYRLVWLKQKHTRLIE